VAWRRQNDTTPNSISRMTILSGTPSNQRMIGIVASDFDFRFHQ
jgi:hypothetical protein